ncbi:MAG TPA: ThiF family adenylyltransferase [Microthrixaceae bacterium]|nr:ThiF family adenylyltransferase [Microthrixaceae bacterium]
MTSTLDPERLGQFLSELADAGFVAGEDGRTFTGPLPASLTKFTTSTEITIVLRDPWPYVQPAVFVTGIDWWHASHESPCLWQQEDNTKRWITLGGLLERIDEWADQAQAGFPSIDGAALDPYLYFQSHAIGVVGIDIDGLVGGLRQDGQHGRLHLAVPPDALAEVRAGAGPPDSTDGLWCFRTGIQSPPRDPDAVAAALTENQRRRLERVLTRNGHVVMVLAWPTAHGTACLPLLITDSPNGRLHEVLRPTPTSIHDLRRRAGPDADALAGKRVAIFGLGAIGSNIAVLLARSGLRSLVAIDGDMKVPAGLVRHAFSGTGMHKVAETRAELAQFGTTVEPVPSSTWDVDEIRELLKGADLCIDATGNSLFAELVSRIARDAAVAFLTVALFRGGRVLRVRRQAAADTPIVEREGIWRYPTIPSASDPAADYLGAETGCAAAIHNAPPAAVAAAASAATIVAIDLLSGRGAYPDEILDVLEPIEAPFDAPGRLRPTPPSVMLSADARATMTNAAIDTHPNETGGILIGARASDGSTCVVEAVEFRPETPSPHVYRVPDGVTQSAVDAARSLDERVGYVGEWHSHPTDQPASATDVATMVHLADLPDSRDPVLFVLRPLTADQFHIDAYVVADRVLERCSVVDVGGLPAGDEP